MELRFNFRALGILFFIIIAQVNISLGQCNCIEENAIQVSWEKYRCEDFDQYNIGSITPQSGHWKKWDGQSGDGVVRKYTNSIGNYLYVDSQNGTDIVYDLGNKGATVYRTSWRMWIYDNYAGYYNIQQGNQGGQSASWAVEVTFERNSTGTVVVDGNQIASFTFSHDDWTNIMHHYDAYEDKMELWINDEFIVDWDYSVANNSNVLGSVNFYGNTNNRYAVETICSYEFNPNIFVQCPAVINPVCVAGKKEYSNSCYAGLAGYTDKEWRQGTCSGGSQPDLCDGFQAIYQEDFEGLAGQFLTQAQPNWWQLGSVLPNNTYDCMVDFNLGTGSYGPDMNGGNQGNTNVTFNAGRIDNGYRSISFDLTTNYQNNKELQNGEIILHAPYIGVLTDQSLFSIRVEYGHTPAGNYARAYYEIASFLGIDVTFISDLDILDSKDHLSNPVYRMDFRINRDADNVELIIDGQSQFTQDLPLFNDRGFTCEFVADFDRNAPVFLQLDNFYYGECESTYEPCIDCSSCFIYWWEDDVCRFKNPDCDDDIAHVGQQGPEQTSYEWNFPSGCVREFVNGSNRFSKDPQCRLNPGTWTICRTITIPQHEVPLVYTCCITVFAPVQPCHEVPPTCGVDFRKSGNNYILDASSTQNAETYSWTVEDSDSGAPINLNLSNSDFQSLDLRGYAGRCLSFCCIATNCYGYSRYCVTICVPGGNSCEEELPPPCGIITPQLNDDELTFIGVPTGFDSYEWSVPTEFDYISGSSNSRNPTCRIPQTGRYVVCLVLKYGCSKVCVCFSVGYGCCSPHDEDLEFDIGEAPCGNPGDLVRVPIRVRNFNSISSFNFSVNLNSNLAGDMIGIEGNRLSGTNVTGNAIDNTHAVLSWYNTQDVSLLDNHIIAYVVVRLSNNNDTEGILSITGDPQEVAYTQDGTVYRNPILINGKFSVCKETNIGLCGQVRREDGVGIKDARVELVGVNSNNTYFTRTDENGEYCFDGIPGQQPYRLSVKKDTNDRNGVDSRDVALINRHILFIDRFDNPYKVIASDASNDGKVFANDLSEILRLVLHLDDEFKTNESWRFVDAGYTFTQANDPFASTLPEVITIQAGNNIISGIDFIGSKIGDVDNSNDASKLNPTENHTRSAGSIDLEFLDAHRNGQSQIVIPVAITNPSQVSDLFNLQFSMTWEGKEQGLSEVRIDNSEIDIFSDNFNLEKMEDGEISFAWFDPNATGIAIDDTTVLFELVFDVPLNEKSMLHLAFTDEPVMISAGSILEQLEVNAYDRTFDIVTSIKYHPAHSTFSVFPNPADDKVWVDFGENKDQTQTLELYSSSGQLILKYYVQSKHDQMEIPVAELKEGIYLLKLTMTTGVSTTPIIVH